MVTCQCKGCRPAALDCLHASCTLLQKSTCTPCLAEKLLGRQSLAGLLRTERPASPHLHQAMLLSKQPSAAHRQGSHLPASACFSSITLRRKLSCSSRRPSSSWLQLAIRFPAPRHRARRSRSCVCLRSVLMQEHTRTVAVQHRSRQRTAARPRRARLGPWTKATSPRSAC